MKLYQRGCTAELGSMSQAMKAQEALSRAAIPSAVIKIESSSRRGCAYGLAFSCEQRNNVEAVLSSARITVKRWTADG